MTQHDVYRDTRGKRTFVCRLELGEVYASIIQLPNGELAKRYDDYYVIETGYYVSETDIVKNLALRDGYPVTPPL